MVTENPEPPAREELRLVEEELAQLRQEVADARRRIAERWDSPTDAAEVSRALTTAEEQEALIAHLESRRLELRRRLGPD